PLLGRKPDGLRALRLVHALEPGGTLAAHLQFDVRLVVDLFDGVLRVLSRTPAVQCLVLRLPDDLLQALDVLGLDVRVSERVENVGFVVNEFCAPPVFGGIVNVPSVSVLEETNVGDRKSTRLNSSHVKIS